MGKVISKSPGAGKFAKGGSGKMFGRGDAAPAVPGQSAPSAQPAESGNWAKGGRGRMFGKGSANTAPSGVSMKNNQ